MRGPHPERTPYVIRVPLASGKYELEDVELVTLFVV